MVPVSSFNFFRERNTVTIPSSTPRLCRSGCIRSLLDLLCNYSLRPMSERTIAGETMILHDDDDDDVFLWFTLVPSSLEIL
uniref:Uncharacterized protein n=1 Tax=Rhizophora mucronata TaxID=61149 RepID=A0A2P2JGS6_RHIMU